MKRLLLLLPIACLAQDVIPVVCPDCNVEALEAPWICPKCGKQLEPPAVAPDPDEEPAEAPDASGADLAAAIRESARFAKTCADDDPACALAAARNALAISALAPDALPPADRKRLVALETSLLARLAAEIAPCPHCRGTGRVDAPKPPKPASRGKNFKSLESVAVADLNKAATQPCPLCGGTGRVRRATDRTRLAGLVGEGVRVFSVCARGTGRQAPFGRSVVWLPLGVRASLSDAERAALDAANPAARACPACAGTGTQPCRSCGGVGRVLCGNRAFHSPPKPVGEGADRKTIEATVLAPSTRAPCPVCGGTWDAPRAVSCHDCGGRGVSACPSCTGTGSAAGSR